MNLHILGCRGVPARHGGFETFAEQFALYMVGQGHQVTVACQGEPGTANHEDEWEGIRRRHYAAPAGPLGTILFDLKSAFEASGDRGATILTLGYNTAVFSVFHRLRGALHFMNMDGVEWRREKWSPAQRRWLRSNEFLGATLADQLVADHPAIKEHLSTLVHRNKIAVIPYGADAIWSMPTTSLERMNLVPQQYFLVIARPEPENSLLEMVQAHTSEMPLVILGRYTPETSRYHAEVMAAARGRRVLFPGAIYDQQIVQELRFHARVYLHGHRVGGTNPSLVEALAAGNAIVAHNNIYNRWVAGGSACFFSSPAELSEILAELASDDAVLESMRAGSRRRHHLCFRKELILQGYENLLSGRPVDMPQWNDLPATAGQE